jgi:hypothetical protein
MVVLLLLLLLLLLYSSSTCGFGLVKLLLGAVRRSSCTYTQFPHLLIRLM